MSDDVAIRRGLRELDAVAAEHPELMSPEARKRCALWLEEEGKSMVMKRAKVEKVPPLSVRFDAETIARLDRIAELLSRPGITLTRMDAIRAAILEGLRVLESDPAVKGKRK